jgi:hypothetical protein
MKSGRTWLLGIAGAGIAALASGCGSSVKAGTAAASPGAATTTPAEEAQQANGDCTARRSDEAIEVTIYGGGEPACVRWDEEAAKSAEEFWKPVKEEPHGQLVCSMEKESRILEIRQGSLVTQGNQICARLLAKGWHEVEGPGERSEREQRETERHQAEQQAQTEAVEKEKRDAAEAVSRQKEDAKLKAEEASLHHREAQERAKEARETTEEAAQQHREEAAQREELAREDRHNEEETKRAEREGGGQ